jgi:hypothetical protein
MTLDSACAHAGSLRIPSRTIGAPAVERAQITSLAWRLRVRYRGEQHRRGENDEVTDSLHDANLLGAMDRSIRVSCLVLVSRPGAMPGAHREALFRDTAAGGRGSPRPVM